MAEYRYKSSSLWVILLLGLLAGCGSNHRAPVNDVAGGPRYLHDGRVHRVNAGETLYAIAWMYDEDYRLLAQVNEIKPPYTIYTGQVISVDTRGHTLDPVPSPQPSPSTSTSPQRSQGSVVRGPSASPATSPSAPAASSPSSESRPQPARQPSSSAGGQVSSATGPVSSWQWPAEGELVGRFQAGDNGQRGLDIAGRRGAPVYAAADGEVVYAGSGLLRYGDMIIIKHNERFLSAYAHNDRLLVAEGERVGRGERIAEMGSTGIDRVMLHFEIRDRGKPVDPLDHLPGR